VWWSGNINFSIYGGQSISISIKTELDLIANYDTSGQTNFAVSLATSASYLYVYTEPYGSSSQIEGSYFTNWTQTGVYVYDDRSWRRYEVYNLTNSIQTLEYRVDTYYERDD